jgi:hypothetical protein
MWDPKHLTNLCASTACYGDIFTFFLHAIILLETDRLNLRYSFNLIPNKNIWLNEKNLGVLSLRKIPSTYFRHMLSKPQGYSAAGIIGLIEKKSNDLFENQIRGLPACSIVLRGSGYSIGGGGGGGGSASSSSSSSTSSSSSSIGGNNNNNYDDNNNNYNKIDLV